MKIYVHLDEDSGPFPPFTLKIDDASSMSVENVVERFCAAYKVKVFHCTLRQLQNRLTLSQHGQIRLPSAASLKLKTG
jgi:hypothetical protein